jgi:hypothetical protein
MKLIRCKVVKELGDENAVIQTTRANWQDEDGNEITEQYSSVRGGIVYPYSTSPGYLVVAGQMKDTEVIRVLAGSSFDLLSGLVENLPHLARDLCLTDVYYDGSTEGMAFRLRLSDALSEMSRTGGIRIPNFYPVYQAASPNYGNDLIRQLLKEGKLLIPAEGELARQMSSNWSEAREEEKLYAVKAFRYLICGFHDRRCREILRIVS